MSEILRKFKTEFPTLNTICVDCGDVFARHNGWECPSNPVRTAFSTEMTSLREIKDKLDKLAEGEIAIMKVLDAIKEQLRTMDAGLHETAMRNHQQLRKELGDEIEKVEVLLLKKLAPPRKASKKARRR